VRHLLALLLSILVSAPLTGCGLISATLKLPSYGPLKHYPLGTSPENFEFTDSLSKGSPFLPIQEIKIIGSLKVNEPQILRITYAEILKDNPITLGYGTYGSFTAEELKRKLEIVLLDDPNDLILEKNRNNDYTLRFDIRATNISKERLEREFSDFAGTKSLDIAFTPKYPNLNYTILTNFSSKYFEYASSWPSFYWGYWTPHEFKFKITK
jgi:hypothetical protein